jgi:plastocyanin
VPNPVQLAAGGQVVWKNNDTTAHHIVLDDGSADVGEIAPGATSRAATLRSAAGNFHCTLHPTMVGSINGSIAAPPSPTDPPRDDGY